MSITTIIFFIKLKFEEKKSISQLKIVNDALGESPMR